MEVLRECYDQREQNTMAHFEQRRRAFEREGDDTIKQDLIAEIQKRFKAKDMKGPMQGQDPRFTIIKTEVLSDFHEQGSLNMDGLGRTDAEERRNMFDYDLQHCKELEAERQESERLRTLRESVPQTPLSELLKNDVEIDTKYKDLNERRRAGITDPDEETFK